MFVAALNVPVLPPPLRLKTTVELPPVSEFPAASFAVRRTVVVVPDAIESAATVITL